MAADGKEEVKGGAPFRAATFAGVVVPAGRPAAALSGRAVLPLGTACARSYLALVLAWFLGLSAPWPFCWAAALALAFSGSWAGLGVGLLLGRRRLR